jgi:hypothetical protein
MSGKRVGSAAVAAWTMTLQVGQRSDAGWYFTRESRFGNNVWDMIEFTSRRYGMRGCPDLPGPLINALLIARKPKIRPSLGEVGRLLEVSNVRGDSEFAQ